MPASFESFVPKKKAKGIVYYLDRLQQVHRDPALTACSPSPSLRQPPPSAAGREGGKLVEDLLWMEDGGQPGPSTGEGVAEVKIADELQSVPHGKKRSRPAARGGVSKTAAIAVSQDKSRNDAPGATSPRRTRRRVTKSEGNATSDDKAL